MPSDPTPGELRIILARLFNLPAADLPDFTASLDAMAAVEAALIASGRWEAYLQALVGDVIDAGPAENAGPAAAKDWLNRILRVAVTAPASVRALAACRVLASVSPPDAPPRP